MSSISLGALMEVIETTREHVEPPSWADISRTRQRYPAAKQIMKQRRKQIRGMGNSYRWPVKVARHQQAQFVGAFAVEDVAVRDMFVHAHVPMRAASGKYAFDIMEQELNSGEEQLVDVIQARRVDAYGDVMDLVETGFWAATLDPADELSPYPIRHTILQHGTLGNGTAGATTAGGFNAQNPTGWADREGLSGATFANWNNWTAGWADMSDNPPGFIYRVNQAIDRTRFEAPYPFPNLSPEEPDYGFYTCYNLRDQINRWLRRSNDNFGPDVRNYHGDPVLSGVPIIWISDLDGDATLPFLGINWKVIDVLASSGWWMKEIGPDRAPHQPTAVEVFVYLMYNIANLDMRRHFQLNYYAALAGAGLT